MGGRESEKEQENEKSGLEAENRADQNENESATFSANRIDF